MADVVGYLNDSIGEGHPFADVTAQPKGPASEAPEVWLLGSSDYSARLAALLGLPFSFADFFGNAGDIGPEVAEIYRQEFKPSDDLPAPKVNVAVHVICADTDEQAAYIASSMKLAVAQMRLGLRRTGLLPPAEAMPYVAEPATLRLINALSRHRVEGSPETVRRYLLDVAARYQTDDLTVATNCYAFGDRLHSYELVARIL